MNWLEIRTEGGELLHRARYPFVPRKEEVIQISHDKFYKVSQVSYDLSIGPPALIIIYVYYF